MSEANRQRAEQLHDEAQSLDDDDKALRLYHDALNLDPERSPTLYNIGLIHKYRGEWADSLTFNRRATMLAPEDEAASWNLAIAATALRDWRTARSTWKRLGMPIDEGESEFEVDFGMTPVRLNPDDAGEVVWGRRIDPVRVRIGNIPYPSSGFRCGDVVLHDGAATGTREWQGQEYAVFNVLELFEPSGYSTFEAEIQIGAEAELQKLCAALDERGIDCEDWTSNVRLLCKQCSEGRPHQHHDNTLKASGDGRHVVGISAVDSDQVRAVLETWIGHGRELLRLEQKLKPPVRHWLPVTATRAMLDLRRT